MKTVTQSLTSAIWRILSGKDEGYDVKQTAREFADLCTDASERLGREGVATDGGAGDTVKVSPETGLGGLL